VRIFEGHAKRETPATPAISLYYALARQLEDISRGIEFGASAPAAGAAAWRARFERHRRMAQRVQRWSEPYAARGLLESLPEPKLRGPTVASFVTSTMDVPRFLQAVEARGHKLSNGYGPLKDKGFRIGHMGDHLESHLEQLLQAMDEALA
jgi:aspartate aminotransferase-like enzyme